VIGAFSVRFWECNPTGLYGSPDVIHQLVYALLLLNTDLHVVDQDRKMTRDGFVENTMGSIRTWAASRQSAPPPLPADSVPADDGTGSVKSGEVFYDAASGPAVDSSAVSTVGKTRRNRSGSIASSFRDRLAQHGSTPGLISSQVGSITSPSASSVALNTPSGSGGDPRPSISRFGSSSASLGSFTLSKAWISEMESLLKVRAVLSISVTRAALLTVVISLPSCRTCTRLSRLSGSFSRSERRSRPRSTSHPRRSIRARAHSPGV
jgi:hypothetical protein